MRITVETLCAKGACSEGIEAFKAFTAPMSGVLDVPEWALAHQLWALISPMREWLGWAWINNVLPQWSMFGANLTGADLTRANLTRADLTGANLTGADLTGANLTGAYVWRDEQRVPFTTAD